MTAVLSEVLLKKMKVVTDASGLTVKDLWERQSKAAKLAAFPDKWRTFWRGISEEKQAVLKALWSFWGRPAQQIPTVVFFIWLILAGRGWGKTATGAQFVIDSAKRNPKSRGALVGATAAEVRDTMILGDSGIIASSPPDFIPIYEPSKKRLTWPNGSYALCYTADKPNRLRGPNLAWAWCDELAAWRYPQQAWDMLMYCMRKGKDPRVCVTTTPRPIPLVRKLAKSAEKAKNNVILTKGTTWDNFWHLSRRFFKEVIEKSKGPLARQEIWAEIVDQIAGALCAAKLIDDNRIEKREMPALQRIVVAVDPPGEDGEDGGQADECGIVACGRDYDGHGYTLADKSMVGPPAKWARKAYDLYLKLDADAIVVEINHGGKMCAHTIRSVIREGEPRPRIIEVRASKGKTVRAEPVSALHTEKRWHHVGEFPELEHEMTTYVPGLDPKFSPGRMDAHVWAAVELFPIHRVHN
jgi:phage terminase large subunit-like protein